MSEHFDVQAPRFRFGSIPDDRCEVEVKQRGFWDRGVRVRQSRPCVRRAIRTVQDPSAGPTRVCRQHGDIFDRRGWV